jgi:Tfp pilus assembly protein PilX
MRPDYSPKSRKSLFADERGSVATIMGLTIIPLMLATGLAADYAVQQSVKTRLNSAADTAALAAIKAAETTMINLSATNPNASVQAIADGVAQGGKSFLVQAARNGANLTDAPEVSVTIVGRTISATATYSASVPTNFGKIAGIKSMALQGTSAASLTMPKYLDFYLLLDVSGSMGLPSTPAGELALAAVNPDDAGVYPGGCKFACHFSWAGGYTAARANNIQLRVDAVGAGVAALMSQAQTTQTLPNQYRVGVYPFIEHANTFVDLTSDLTGDAASVASAINYNPATGTTDFGKLLDSGDDSLFASSLNPNYKKTSSAPADVFPMGSGGTHIDNIFNDISAKIVTVGDGSSALKPQPFVFFISDGMEDSQSFVTATGAWPGVTSWPTPPGQTVSIRAMDPTLCTSLKARGVTVAVMQIPYPPLIPPQPFANSQDFKAQAAQPNLSPAMLACASPGFYTYASTPADIAAGIQNLFFEAVQLARLTQ